ncbi:Pro-Pol polyprotein [Gossypium australe]|uniref:Pro-Pol polyprotein n=1 Tax=Gossypium australe TaxID=47621 RepID=A0A5B6X4M2_9ROSI|nr:Pro-Pol polyprotein [Gossypium australe]
MGEDTGVSRPCEGHGPETRACARPSENPCSFKASNNVTEYEILIVGLQLALQLGSRELIIYTDSQLATKQLNEDY